MKTNTSRRGKAGFASYLLVFSTVGILTFLTVITYRRAIAAQTAQAKVQLRTDYSEKEDAVLRSIMAITPNRAIRAMQNGSNSSTTVSHPLRWENIFTEALVLANARTSIPTEVQTSIKGSLNVSIIKTGNAGDSGLATPSAIFKAISPETGFVSTGVNRSLGTGFPPPLTTSTTTRALDLVYPIISSKCSPIASGNDKVYGALAQSSLDQSDGLSVTSYPNLYRLVYPQISFGYARPGDPFVAKRNWWAFSMDVAAQDATMTQVVRPGRDFVLSIYEIPSQLAISASSFMSLGQYSSGSAWENVTISGGVFGGRVNVEGDTVLPALSSRRGMTLSGDATVGGQVFANNPFTPGGDRDIYQLTQGDFFPVSLASESGRVAFVPINRGAEFFERFDPVTRLGRSDTPSNSLSPTSWDAYSIGALQCAMRVDITQCVSAANKTPTKLRFSYYKGGVRMNRDIILANNPPGYDAFWVENNSYNFGTEIVDVAYGKNGTYAYKNNVTGSISFNNATFGDPLVGTFKSGYLKLPFEYRTLGGGNKPCIAVYPRRFKALLAALGADSTAVNHSLVVNVDYTTATGSNLLSPPSIPCTDSDYGLILQECSDLTSFTKGFSLVTNLRTYIGDDVNQTPFTAGGTDFPPISLFMPEKRFGVDVDPYAVTMSGQVGSLAKLDKVIGTDAEPMNVRPLDSKNLSGNAIDSGRLSVNLRPITHPRDLPPITMMNWLVLLEERRKEFIGN